MKSIKEMLDAKKLISVKSGTNIYDAVCYMAEQNVGLIPVFANDGKLLGVFSERDLVKRVIAKNVDLKTTKIDEVMTKELLLADISETHEQCLKKMQERGTRHVLIIENEKLVGIISMRDLLELDIKVHQETIDVLHKYIYST